MSTQGVPYDIGSIMHYRFNAFTNNGNPTILPLDTSIDKEQLGQRDGLSDMDLQHVQMLYCGGEHGGLNTYLRMRCIVFWEFLIVLTTLHEDRCGGANYDLWHCGLRFSVSKLTYQSCIYVGNNIPTTLN